jgi:hypothetical protein
MTDDVGVTVTAVDDADWCDYADFGRAFFEVLVTADRIAGAVDGLAGQTLEIGPIPVGPAGIARATVSGRVGTPVAVRHEKEPLTFRLTIPADIDLLVEVGLQANRFHGTVTVGLDLTVRAARPLRLVVEIDPPMPEDVEVNLAPDGLRASLLQAFAGMDAEIAKFVARYVAREIASPRVSDACEIDIAARVDAAWAARAR